MFSSTSQDWAHRIVYKIMNFSFVVPSLGNREMLTRMLESFERTTRYKNQIEFLIVVDTGMCDKINEWFNPFHYTFNVAFCEQPKTDDFVKNYYNFLANRSHGNTIIPFNDDAWMRTNHWDVKLLETIKEYGWSIYLLDIPDTARIKYAHNFPCFPGISRRGMNTLGYALCNKVRMYPADSLTFSIYHGAGRVIPIRNVLIEHEHIEESDPSKSRLMRIFNEDMQKPIDLTDEIHKLALVASSEILRKSSKLNRIIKILQEKS